MSGILKLPSEETTANSYIIEEEGSAILVDAVRADIITNAIEKEHLILEMILLTHEHVDHIFALEEIRKLYKVPVLSTAICSKRMGDRRENLSLVYDMLVYSYTGLITKKRHKPFTCAPSDITFEEEHRLSWKGRSFELTRCPGHSPGSCIIIMDGSCAFTGDYMDKAREDNLTLLGGCGDDYYRITRPWMSEHLVPGMTIYPGHGMSYTI